jgi:hypothetical protein
MSMIDEQVQEGNALSIAVIKLIQEQFTLHDFNKKPLALATFDTEIYEMIENAVRAEEVRR